MELNRRYLQKGIPARPAHPPCYEHTFLMCLGSNPLAECLHAPALYTTAKRLTLTMVQVTGTVDLASIIEPSLPAEAVQWLALVHQEAVLPTMSCAWILERELRDKASVTENKTLGQTLLDVGVSIQRVLFRNTCPRATENC